MIFRPPEISLDREANSVSSGTTMSPSDQFSYLLSAFAAQVPLLAVCILALIVIATKWKQAPEAARWAFLGFGLGLLLCLITPIGQWLIQSWILESSGRGNLVWVLSVFGFANVILHAGVYVLLLVAIFAGRNRDD
jgi:hypothetical protein